MKRPNKKHRSFIKAILDCDDEDILQHRMMRLPQVVRASIDGGWTTYARFEFHNGKTFRTSWCLNGEKQLKEIFKEMLQYMRKQRRGDVK